MEATRAHMMALASKTAQQEYRPFVAGSVLASTWEERPFDVSPERRPDPNPRPPPHTPTERRLDSNPHRTITHIPPSLTPHSDAPRAASL